MYGMLYGMKKTTLYLPDELKVSIERIAFEERRSEAEIIREALQNAVNQRGQPRPRIPLTSEGLGDPTAAERTEDLLQDFGNESC